MSNSVPLTPSVFRFQGKYLPNELEINCSLFLTATELFQVARTCRAGKNLLKNKEYWTQFASKIGLIEAKELFVSKKDVFERIQGVYRSMPEHFLHKYCAQRLDSFQSNLREYFDFHYLPHDDAFVRFQMDIHLPSNPEVARAIAQCPQYLDQAVNMDSEHLAIHTIRMLMANGAKPNEHTLDQAIRIGRFNLIRAVLNQVSPDAFHWYAAGRLTDVPLRDEMLRVLQELEDNNPLPEKEHLERQKSIEVAKIAMSQSDPIFPEGVSFAERVRGELRASGRISGRSGTDLLNQSISKENEVAIAYCIRAGAKAALGNTYMAALQTGRRSIMELAIQSGARCSSAEISLTITNPHITQIVTDRGAVIREGLVYINHRWVPNAHKLLRDIGWKPLSIGGAIQSGDENMIQWALRSVKYADDLDLYAALSAQREDLVKPILQRGVFSDPEGILIRVFSLASTPIGKRMALLVWEKLQKPKYKTLNLSHVVVSKDLSLVQLAIKGGVKPYTDRWFRSKENEKNNTVNLAIDTGDIQIVREVLDAKAPLTEVNEKRAEKAGNLDILSLISSRLSYKPPLFSLPVCHAPICRVPSSRSGKFREGN